MTGYCLDYSPWEETDDEKVYLLVNDVIKKHQLPISLESLEGRTCLACRETFKDPVTGPCGHVYCTKCVISGKCQIDGGLMTTDIEDLEVSCLCKESGCDWVGNGHGLLRHMAKECDLVMVRACCEMYCERRVLEECGFLEKVNGDYQVVKPISCQGAESIHSLLRCEECAGMIMRKDYRKHVDADCYDTLFPCEWCELNHPGKDDGSHGSECPSIKVDCNGTIFGCNWRGTRQLFEDEHAMKCGNSKIAKYVTKLENRVDVVEQENKVLKSQVNELLDAAAEDVNTDSTIPEISSLTSSFNKSHISTNNTDNNIFDIEDDFILNPNIDPKITLMKIKMVLGEMEMNKNVTKSLVDENIILHEQLNNQRAMIMSLQQQLQFLMIERRRSHMEHPTSQSQSQYQNRNKIPTKL